jgi:LPS-assembly lipoprotein
MNRLRASLIGLILLSLTSCGFTPLYAVPGVASGLSTIAISAPQGRSGFLLRQSLDDAFAHDASAPAAYRLGLSYNEQKIPRGVRINNVANRYELVLTVGYTLTTTTGTTTTANGITTTASAATDRVTTYCRTWTACITSRPERFFTRAT